MIEAFLLTGGRSQRMGRDKATLPIDGEGQAARMVRRLAEVGIRTTVLGKEPIDGADFLPDDESVHGPLDALRRARPKADHVFVASCDLPRFDPRLVAVLHSWIDDNQAAVPFVDGFRQPMVGLYAASAFDRIPSEGCPMDWLKVLVVKHVLEDDLMVAGIDPASTRGANTPEELDRLLTGTISFREAWMRVVTRSPIARFEHVPLDQAGGRVLFENLTCPSDVPAFDNSQVDGYAVRSEDGDVERVVIGESAAGGSVPPPVGRGEAVRIFTGAPIPTGADAVVMQEDAEIAEGRVRFTEPVGAGAFIRRQGEEIRAGTEFPTRGRTVTPPLVGLAASFGASELPVSRPPSVSIVATGNELVPVGDPLGPGQIHASNAAALEDALRAMGIRDVSTAIVPDVPAEVEEALARAIVESEVVITVGGVSVGDHDLIRPSLARLGAETIVERVAMKPGKPFYFGYVEGTPVYGLPGNPVSALVTFAVLVRPSLLRMMGLGDVTEEFPVQLSVPIGRRDTRYEFVRATLQGSSATPVEHQGSHMQTGLAFADVLLHLPEGVADFAAGETLRATPLRWGLR